MQKKSRPNERLESQQGGVKQAAEGRFYPDGLDRCL